MKIAISGKASSLAVSTFLLAGIFAAYLPAIAALPEPAGESILSNPGAATYNASTRTFGNRAIQLGWGTGAGAFSRLTLTDLVHGNTFTISEPFAVVLRDGTTVRAQDMDITTQPAIRAVTVVPGAASRSDTLPGKDLTAVFRDRAGRFAVEWTLRQRDDTPYLRQVITITALQTVDIAEIKQFAVQAAQVEAQGTVPGTPVLIGAAGQAAGTVYVGFELPQSESQVVTAGSPSAAFKTKRALVLNQGNSLTYSAVAGVVRTGQVRRDFLSYIETERARPYQPLLHYNSWYDIGYSGKFDGMSEIPYSAESLVSRASSFGEELCNKRGAQISSFLFDSGWDNFGGNWDFNNLLPNGFVPVKDVAATFGAAPGAWLSPKGGYDNEGGFNPLSMRAAGGAKLGYEIQGGEFVISGPKYYPRVLQVVKDLMVRNGVNQFKFDGFGSSDIVWPGSQFTSNYDAMIALVGEARRVKPELFVNATVGSFPSPFWLRYADSIWRQGGDTGSAGVGTQREQWITYRDGETYKNIVSKAKLYPLNSLMLHGIVRARGMYGGGTTGQSFRNEVRSYFGSGTQLQELYVSPELLQPSDWDILAEAANWSRDNAQTLRDTHWVGGDPKQLKVYGWAAWSPAKGILTLRNPSTSPQSFAIDLQAQLELPSGAPSRFDVKRKWGAATVPAIMNASEPTTVTLAAFEVITVEFTESGSIAQDRTSMCVPTGKAPEKIFVINQPGTGNKMLDVPTLLSVLNGKADAPANLCQQGCVAVLKGSNDAEYVAARIDRNGKNLTTSPGFTRSMLAGAKLIIRSGPLSYQIP